MHNLQNNAFLGIKRTSYNAEQQRTYRKFVKTYLSDEYLGRHSYLTKFEFETFRRDNLNLSKYLEGTSTVYGYWLPNSNCYGLTLDSNETVILECISNNTLPNEEVKSGCFRIINQKIKTQQEHIVCTKVLNDTCVGITTPLKQSVVLACYSQSKNIRSKYMLISKLILHI